MDAENINFQNVSDNELVTVALGEPLAFSALYRRYLEKIYKYCYYRVSSEHDAEDLTAKVFTLALQKLSTFNGKKGNFSSWIYRIAHNQIVDFYRAARRKDISIHIISEPRSEEDQFEDALLEARRIQVQHVLQKLNTKYQLVLSLKFFSELELDEIAESMGYSKKNISVILHRALKSFEKQFQKEFPETEISRLSDRNHI